MASYRQIFITDQRISTLPTTGTPYSNMKADADDNAITNASSWILYDNNLDTDNLAYANGLMWARTGNSFYRTRAYNAVMGVIGKEDDPSSGPYYSYLPVLRHTCAYVLAADLINLPEMDPSGATTFANWLSVLKTKNVGGSADGGPASIVYGTTNTVKNFYGGAIASRIAIEKYLNQSLTASADLMQGWLGDLSKRSSGWSTSGCWDIANLSPSMGLQPIGTTTTAHGISGYAIDGCCHDDWRRSTCPSGSPAISNYVYGVWSGVCLATEMLRLAGYDSLNWVSQGVKRGADFIKKYADDFGLSYATTDEYKTIWWMFDYFYNAGYPKTGGGTIKHKASLSYPDWTHATPLTTGGGGGGGGGGPPTSGTTYTKTGLGRSARTGRAADADTWVKTNAGVIGGNDTPKTATLTDNFGDGIIDPIKWRVFTSGNATVQETGGVLRVTVDNTLASQYGGLYTPVTYDLKESTCSFRMAAKGTPSANCELYLLLTVDSANSTQISWRNSNVVAITTVDGTTTSTNTAASTATHLRMRHTGTSLFFEYSTNGTSWTVARTVTQQFAVDDLTVTFAAGHFATDAANTFDLDDVNL